MPSEYLISVPDQAFYAVDPELQITSDPMTQFPGSLEGATLSGVFITPPPGADWAPIPLSRSGYSYMVTGAGGWNSIQNDILWSSLNQSTSTRSQQGVSGVINVELPNGTVLPLSIDFAQLSPVGTRLAVYVDNNGVEQYTSVPANKTLRDLQQQFPDYTRFASADEAARNAIAGYVRGLYESEAEEVALENGWFTSQGTPDTYYAIAHIAEYGVGVLQPRTRYIIG